MAINQLRIGCVTLFGGSREGDAYAEIFRRMTLPCWNCTLSVGPTTSCFTSKKLQFLYPHVEGDIITLASGGFAALTDPATTMAAPNPLLNAYPTLPKPVSKKTYCVAGLLTTVYGLEELPKDIEGVACLWLLHPRLQDQTCMEPIACSAINAWNTHLGATKRDKGVGVQGLVAASFDQRNHGSRKVDDVANQDWSSGNQRHAQDMFSIYRMALPRIWLSKILRRY